MEPKIQLASVEEKDTIAIMMEAYLHELSAYREIAIGATTVAEYPYFKLYWIEPERHPFFIHYAGEVAGFALIRQVRLYPLACTSVAEFYILPGKRRLGIGRTAVQLLWKHFPGDWELQVIKNNKPGLEFWRSCIHTYASSWRVEEIQAQDGKRFFYHFEIKP